jgi:predicted RNA binding protein YcfA (HicA-like mRNA interferase family)
MDAVEILDRRHFEGKLSLGARRLADELGDGTMKVRAIIKLIEADGWYRIKTRGGHRQYKHPIKPGRVTVPGQMNADLDQKTEISILKQAGLQE